MVIRGKRMEINGVYKYETGNVRLVVGYIKMFNAIKKDHLWIERDLDTKYGGEGMEIESLTFKMEIESLTFKKEFDKFLDDLFNKYI
jgi:hypothetical protein